MKYLTLSLLCLSVPALSSTGALAQQAAATSAAPGSAHTGATVSVTPVSAPAALTTAAPVPAPVTTVTPAAPSAVAVPASPATTQPQPAAAQEATAPPALAPAPAADPQAPGATVLISNPWPTTPPAPKVDEPPPQPIHQRFELHLGVNSVLNRDSGYDVFSKNDAWRSFFLALEADLIQLSPETALGLQLGYAYGSTDDGNVPSQVGVGASLYSHQPNLGVLFKWRANSWFAVHARAHAGYSFSKLSIDRSSIGEAVSVSQSSPFAGLGAGVNFTSPALRIAKNRDFLNGLSLGARVEGGYSFAKAIHASFPDQAANPPERRIPLRGADLGELERSGPFLYLGGFLRF